MMFSATLGHGLPNYLAGLALVVSFSSISVQLQVLNLLSSLQERLGFAMLLITHNLAVVERLADEVVVMRTGAVLEHVATAALFARPAHPYTRSLLDAVLPVRISTNDEPRPRSSRVAGEPLAADR